MPAQPLEYRQWLFAQGDFVGVVGRGQAGHVSNVFTERLLAVDMHTRQRLVGAELIGQPFTCFLEVRAVFPRPPVLELAG